MGGGADDAVEFTEPFVAFFFVAFGGDVLVEWEREEAAEAGGAERGGAAGFGGGRARLVRAEVGAEASEDAVGDLKVSGAGIGGVDNVPRGAGALGGAAHGVGEASEAVVIAVAFPIFGGDAPSGTFVFLEFLEAGALAVLSEVQPDFNDEGTIGGELVFETSDAAKRGVEFGEVAGAARVFAEGFGVPAAGVDADATVRREAAPEAPHGGALAFFVGGFVEGEGFDAARVEPGVEGVDDFAFAGGVDPGDDDEHGERRVFQLHLHVDKLGAGVGDAGLVGFFRKALGVGFGHAPRGVAAGAGVVEPRARGGGDVGKL